MPFDIQRFKDACHQRAMNVAILAMGRPIKGRPIKAAVITEHTAWFPEDPRDECYVTLVLRTVTFTTQALVESQYFSLNFLKRADRDAAKQIYRGNMTALQWAHRHNVPYVPNANSSIICSFQRRLQLKPHTPNTLIVGHVFDVIVSDSLAKPLVNYNRGFCSVDDDIGPVHDPTIDNPRLT